MKVAIVLRGQPRNFRIGYKHLHREIISRYNADVFAHCWWDESIVGQNYSTAPQAPKHYIAEENMPAKLNELYKFKGVHFEKPKTFKPKRKYKIPLDHDQLYNVLNSCYYSQNKVLTLLKIYEEQEKFEYDWVINTRYDIGIFKPFPNLFNLDKNKIYVSDYHKGRKFIFNDNLWIFGKHKYAFIDLFEKFDEVYDKMLKFPYQFASQVIGTEIYDKKYLSGEQHLTLHLLFKNLLKHVIEINKLDYNIIR